MPLQDLRPEGEVSPNGWVRLKCRNHEHLRWVMKDPRTMHQRISQNSQLMFRGDVNQPDKPGYTTNDMSAGTLADMVERGVCVAECSCPYGDLVVIENSGWNAD